MIHLICAPEVQILVVLNRFIELFITIILGSPGPRHRPPVVPLGFPVIYLCIHPENGALRPPASGFHPGTGAAGILTLLASRVGAGLGHKLRCVSKIAEQRPGCFGSRRARYKGFH